MEKFNLQEVPKKIAFLFLIYDKINKEDYWYNFFKDVDPSKYSIYIHYKTNKPLKYFEKYKVKHCIPTEYGGITLIHAHNILFQEAYKDPSNYKFINLSGACIPFKTFDYIYDFLTKNEKGYFNTSPQSQCFPRCDELLQFYSKEDIQKSANWFILNRNLVEILALKDKEYINTRYTNISAAEEHYFITELYNKKVKDQIIETMNEAEKATTFTNWKGYNYKYANKGKKVKTYKYISKEEWEYLKKSPCLFGRKFNPECMITSNDSKKRKLCVIQ
jgi:hypothetical protein